MNFRRFSASLFSGVLVGVSAYAHAALQLSSPDFANGQPLPARCAHARANVPPTLQISGVPAGAKSLALVLDDPDAPSGLFTHWLVWDIPASTTSISAGALPPGAQQGRNTMGDTHYDGPAPPRGTHRYVFHLYALDAPPMVPAGANRAALLGAMKGHILAQTQIIGTFAAGQ